MTAECYAAKSKRRARSACGCFCGRLLLHRLELERPEAEEQMNPGRKHESMLEDTISEYLDLIDQDIAIPEGAWEPLGGIGRADQLNYITVVKDHTPRILSSKVGGVHLHRCALVGNIDTQLPDTPIVDIDRPHEPMKITWQLIADAFEVGCICLLCRAALMRCLSTRKPPSTSLPFRFAKGLGSRAPA
jgi:hypothetical protein